MSSCPCYRVAKCRKASVDPNGMGMADRRAHEKGPDSAIETICHDLMRSKHSRTGEETQTSRLPEHKRLAWTLLSTRMCYTNTNRHACCTTEHQTLGNADPSFLPPLSQHACSSALSSVHKFRCVACGGRFFTLHVLWSKHKAGNTWQEL